MKLNQSVLFGAWFLIGVNVLMSLGSIWMFNRMAPAIERIIERNERSLLACEEMLSALSLTDGLNSGFTRDSLSRVFTSALDKAGGNITEQDEPQAITDIRREFDQALNGDTPAKKRTISAINRLSAINRNAMVQADINARQIGSAGAWGVVFMATAVFLSGLLFIRKMNRTLIEPLSHIHAVLSAFEQGNTVRRCTESNVPRDTANTFRLVNYLLDQCRNRENSGSTKTGPV